MKVKAVKETNAFKGFYPAPEQKLKFENTPTYDPVTISPMAKALSKILNSGKKY